MTPLQKVGIKTKRGGNWGKGVEEREPRDASKRLRPKRVEG